MTWMVPGSDPLICSLEDLKPDDVYVQIGKVAIAHVILSGENGENLVGPNKTRDHWYEYVWNLMRPGSSPENR